MQMFRNNSDTSTGVRMLRPFALLLALALYVSGVWAVAATDWTPRPPTPRHLAQDAAPPAVATPAATAPTAKAANAAWTLATLRAHLVAELDATDPRTALADLDRITRRQPLASRFCHAVAHELGHAALAKYHGDFAKAVSYQNDVCGSGYLHGVVEEKLSQAADPATAVTTLCSPQQTDSCLHGIGHGAMFVSDLDVTRAEHLCDRFPQTGQVVSCSEGLFMQLFEPDESDPHAMAQLPAQRLAAEPFYPCPDQPGVYQSACYFYAPAYFLQRHDYATHPESFAAALRWCRSAPSADGRATCTRGAGSRLMKYTMDRPGWVGEQCLAAAAWQRGLCMDGAVSYWDVNFADSSARSRLCPQLAPAARRLCESATAGSDSAD